VGSLCFVGNGLWLSFLFVVLIAFFLFTIFPYQLRWLFFFLVALFFIVVLLLFFTSIILIYFFVVFVFLLVLFFSLVPLTNVLSCLIIRWLSHVFRRL